ncbi:MAG: hypothetical protein HY072_04910 [Deltaproteobacteria bacterium]|nr:hypothetical protein [Deltaproteobacteria bacterium]
MTTKKRLQWWQTNDVPTQGIRYYSVVSVFADPLDSKRLSKNSPSYNQKLLDYKFSLRNYRHLRKISQVKLNDSQMTFEKAIFLPELIKLLNPKQPLLSTCLLGVLGTHHWGMAIPIVMKMKDGSLDPFPREILLKSIATSIAIDLQ